MNGISILNMIKSVTANSMAQSIRNGTIYVAAESNSYAGYNTTGLSIGTVPMKSIVCGTSLCGSDERPLDEVVKRK